MSDLARAHDTLHLQAGVVSRRQLAQRSLLDHDIRRLVRRRELAVVHPGVYVNHTGTLTWVQRAWAAVLFAEPAALYGVSSLRALNGPGRRNHDDGGPIHVAVEHSRAVRAPAGVEVHRVVRVDDQVLWHTAPPRQRIEDAVLDLAASASREIDAVAYVADVVGSRLTTGSRLSEALARRSRVARRSFLAGVIADVTTGVCSTLEHGYLNRVERPHGLPTACRQVRSSAKGPVYLDVLYEDYDTVIELDGRLFHARTRDRDRDLERDLDAAVSESVTARLGWGQVFDRPCSTAVKVGAILAARGWDGRTRPCRECWVIATKTG
jgi:hypothetical protein